MRQAVVAILGAGLALAATATPLLAEDGASTVAGEDGESGIQFAPDDEPQGDMGPPAPKTPPAKPAGADGEPSASGRTRQIQTTASPEPETHLRIHSGREGSIFGTYRVRLSLNRPTFDDHLKYYDKLYGTPSVYPMIGADWYAFDWYATLGLSLRMGYYTAEGHAARGLKDKKDLTSSDIVKDPNGPTTLTLVPLQACISAQFTPFQRKWLVVDGWVGVEHLYFQEVRSGGASGSSVAPTPTPTPTPGVPAPTTTTGTSDQTLTNRGWNNSSVVGASLNILLNPLDETSANSLRGPMGIGSIYLSPFVERVRTHSTAGVSFGRTVVGVGFTFETVN